MRISKFISSTVVALGVTVAAMTAQADSHGGDGDMKNLLTILTSENPQTQLMAMVLTMNAIKAGAKAEMLLCGPAGDIALRDAPASATAGQPPKDMSPQKLMQKMMADHDLRVGVCALYLPAKGADMSVLLEGVTSAKPDEMGAAVVADNTTVMSF